MMQMQMPMPMPIPMPMPVLGRGSSLGSIADTLETMAAMDMDTMGGGMGGGGTAAAAAAPAAAMAMGDEIDQIDDLLAELGDGAMSDE